MELSEILNLILGGSLIGSILAIVTLRSTVRKAKAEAAKAEADAETVRVDNAEHATRILIENIVKPLKEELNATREELLATKKEMVAAKRTMSRLTKAVEAANDCRHVDDCPVRHRLRDHQTDRQPDGDASGPYGGRHLLGIPRERNDTARRRDGPTAGQKDDASVYVGECAAGTGEDGFEDTEPP